MVRLDIARSEPELAPILIFLGDYIDRGPDSRGVIDHLIALKADPMWTVVTLRGNHEHFLLSFLKTEGSVSASNWLDHGGRDTFASYGVEAPLHRLSTQDNKTAALRLADAIPESHHRFLKETTLSVSYGSYLFVHAGIKPGRPLKKQTSKDLMSIRGAFLRSNRPLKNTVVVFGHTVFDAPLQTRWKIGLDTGAYVSGCLTALRIDGRMRTFISVCD